MKSGRHRKMLSWRSKMKSSNMGLSLLLLVLLSSFEVGLVHGLAVNVHIPSYKERGEYAELKCLYSLDKDSLLYSVKWYKEDKQFYAYIPQNRIPKSTFEIPYLTVDLEASNEGSVILRNLSLKTSGTFKCEVITETPHFHTEFRNGNMTVIDLPESAPILAGVKHSYQLGDEVRVNCTSPSSMPAPTLTWYINDEPVKNPSSLIEYDILLDEEKLLTVKLGLRFVARRQHFQNGSLRLKCKAQIGHIYYQSQENVALSSFYLKNQPSETSSHFRHFFLYNSTSELNSSLFMVIFQFLPHFILQISYLR